MRSLQEIREVIRATFVANLTIQSSYNLDPTKTFAQQFSNMSLESAIIDVMTLVSWTMENIFQTHKEEVDGILRDKKPHTLRWYRNKALRFRLGQSLIVDTDGYDDTGLTQQDIESLEVVKCASAIEVADGTGIPLVRIKVAGHSGGNLVALGQPTQDAIKSYFDGIKDAGVKLLVSSGQPDYYRAEIEVYYDPLVLDSDGISISNGNEPVRDAVTSYLLNLPFNGEFSTTALSDAIQRTAGVVLFSISNSETKYGSLPWSPTGIRCVPDAGYMKVYINTDLIINYIPYTFNE